MEERNTDNVERHLSLSNVHSFLLIFSVLNIKKLINFRTKTFPLTLPVCPCFIFSLLKYPSHEEKLSLKNLFVKFKEEVPS